MEPEQPRDDDETPNAGVRQPRNPFRPLRGDHAVVRPEPELDPVEAQGLCLAGP